MVKRALAAEFADPGGKMWMVLAVAAVAGMLAIWFLPAGAQDQFEPILRFLTMASVTFSLAIWWLASRLRRTDVTSVERFARRVFFTNQR